MEATTKPTATAVNKALRGCLTKESIDKFYNFKK